jgi:polyhydroxybutyrate depolymerase
MAGSVLISVACGGATAATATHPSPIPVEDCRGATESGPYPPNEGPSVKYESITVDGKLRDYRLFQSVSVDSAKPVAAVLVMPPPSADAEALESLIQFDSEASAAGFLAVTPNGCDANWPYIQGGSKAADEDFIRSVINQLQAEFHVTNVYAVSASGGSRILYRLACDLASEITAIADVAGTMILKDDCVPARPVSILQMHGTADSTSPWEGGGPNGSYPVEAVNQRWRTLDGCVGDPTSTTVGITISSVWAHCNGGAVVRLDKVVGGKHTWFGSGDSDAVPGEPDANSVIWGFFSSLQPPA